jgi:hypothetical protein
VANDAPEIKRKNSFGLGPEQDYQH